MTKKPKLTVGEIAKRIREPGEDLTAVTDRLRNWTGEGLLKTIDQKNPGAGQKRLYPERALVDAAILSRLARYFGVRAPYVPLFGGALDLANKWVSKAKDIPPEKDLYLLVGLMEDQQGKPSERWQIISDVRFVDTASRSRSVKAGLPKRDLRLPDLMGDGLFINLSAMFKRLEEEESFYKMYPQARRIIHG